MNQCKDAFHTVSYFFNSFHLLIEGTDREREPSNLSFFLSLVPQKVAAGSVVVHSTASQVLTMHINVSS